jgi:hypothetical protein
MKLEVVQGDGLFWCPDDSAGLPLPLTAGVAPLDVPAALLQELEHERAVRSRRVDVDEKPALVSNGAVLVDDPLYLPCADRELEPTLNGWC